MDGKAALDKAINECGGIAELARRIGRSPQIVAYWRKAKKGVPAEAAPDIEKAVSKKVTRRQLRPDVFGATA